MQIKFHSLDEGDDSGRSTKNAQEPIFNQHFQVSPMDDPFQFINKYQNKAPQQTSAVEDCSICCGNICICLAFPFACCCCKCCCVYELGTSKAGIVEEFGKFKRLLKPGFNMINPCSEQVGEVDLRIRMIPASQHSTITKDNVKVNIKVSVAYRVNNPVVAYYSMRQALDHAISELAVSTLRNIVGEQVLQEVLTNRSRIAKKTTEQVERNLPGGVLVDRVFMEQIIIPPNIQKDLASAARQRRISQANIINSQADVKTASLMKQSAQLLDTKAAMQIRYLEMVQELGKEGVVLMMEVGVKKKGFKH